MNAGESVLPSMSVVLVAATGADSIARTISHLRQQTARSQVELIVVVANEQELNDAQLGRSEFQAVRVISVGEILERGDAAAHGMRCASAPIVGLIEDHSFPEPGWAAALIKAHSGPWAGVGPAVRNANPGSALSWVNFVLAYGAFSPPQQSGTRTVIPWHNSAYKKALLKPYEDQLGDLLSWEGTLQDELCREGHTLYLEPSAETHHANVSALFSTIGLHLQRGRLMGALRANREKWPEWRRWLFGAAFPLYPIMQFRYALPGLQRQQLPMLMRVRVLCMLVPALMAMAIGEARGIIAGPGDALRRLEDYELRRLKHVSRRERRELGSLT